MTLTVLPLLVSSVFHHVIVIRSVIGDFQDVATRQRDQLMPAQQLQVSLWEAAEPIDLYLIDGDPGQPVAYRLVREKIETRFAHLHGALGLEPEARDLVERARADWTAADRAAGQILSMRSPGQSEAAVALVKQIEASIAGAADKLTATTRELDRKVDEDYLAAGRSAERADWIAAIAAGIALLSMAAGVFLIGYLLSRSVDRLVDGAERFAAGERDHRIDVHVPPELHRVAEEFNHMIGRIRESEAALTDLARRDALTGLPNRRALDDMLSDALARLHRMNESFALAVVDVDFFKNINDTHGHAAGDQVLRQLATRLTASVRQVDKVFRVGGEEFVVLLCDSDRTSAHAATERIRAAIAARPLAVNGVTVPVTISAGAVMAFDGSSSDGLIGAADEALYRAKSAGRNRVEWAA